MKPKAELTEHTQPLMEHLLELRRRFISIILGIALCCVLTIPFAQELYAFIAHPLIKVLPEGTNMIATDVISPFFAPLKVAFSIGFLLALPNTLYQLWAFIAPALYQNEKRLILPLVLSSLGLFFAGMAFCYFVVFPTMFTFFVGKTPEGVQMATDISQYLSFIFGMFIAFGITFEIPIAVILLHRMGAISLSQMRAAQPYIIVGAFVIAAVVTPPDVLSQIMLALPMIALYEIGLLLCRMTKVCRLPDDDNDADFRQPEE